MQSAARAPKVSVVIPAFNAMKYLPETLASVLAQDFSDFEVIIVDDGSTDPIAEWFATVQDPRVRLVRQENRGLAGARNRGIEDAGGELIALLDADDLWRPDKLRRQVDLLDSEPEVGLVYCWVEVIDSVGLSRGVTIRNTEAGRIWRTLVERNVVECGSTPLIRRQCFETVGLFDTELGSYVEDRDMWLRIAARYAVAVVPEPLVRYRHHPGGASRNWRAMERSTRLVNEKALSANPEGLSETELAELRRRSYGSSYLRLAWKPLQTQELDAEAAHGLLAAAVEADPAIKGTREYKKLSVALTLAKLLGPKGYKRALQGADRIRGSLQ